MFVETLDKCFENVCELDLIFHMEKVNITSYPPLHSGIKGRWERGVLTLSARMFKNGEGGGNVKSSSIRIQETEKI